MYSKHSHRALFVIYSFFFHDSIPRGSAKISNSYTFISANHVNIHIYIVSLLIYDRQTNSMTGNYSVITASGNYCQASLHPYW